MRPRCPKPSPSNSIQVMLTPCARKMLLGDRNTHILPSHAAKCHCSIPRPFCTGAKGCPAPECPHTSSKHTAVIKHVHHLQQVYSDLAVAHPSQPVLMLLQSYLLGWQTQQDTDAHTPHAHARTAHHPLPPCQPGSRMSGFIQPH
jgi:hypothetical protein